MTITIPNIGNNPLVVIVGGKRYAYGAGETVTVPDEVGNEILHMMAAMDNPAPNVELPFKGELPKVTSTDNGKVLRVVSGAWAAAQLPSASGVSF